jgi:hypothetical protein
MAALRNETLVRIGTTQTQLNGLRTTLRRLDELCRDLESVDHIFYCDPDSNNTEYLKTDLELARLKRDLEREVQQCLADTTIKQR